MNKVITIFSVILFSLPMTLIENWLVKNTRLVKYGKDLNGFYTFAVYTMTFWVVKLFMAGIRFIDQKRNTSEMENKCCSRA
jgi:hypothetical protein